MLPDEFGVKESPWFFLSPQYWGYARKEEKIILDQWLDKVQQQYVKCLPDDAPKSGICPRIFKRRNQPQTSIPVTPPPISDPELSAVCDVAFDVSTPVGLRVVHLRKTFGRDCLAVSDTSFVMESGEILAILGANGSGKSTTCHVLCGITPATAGGALLDDSVNLLDRTTRGQIGWCPQHDILFDDLTPMEHV